MKLGLGPLHLASVVSVLLAAACAAPSGDVEANESPVIQTASFPLASNLPEHCAGPEIFRVERQVKTASGTKSFSYGFRFKAPSVQGAPVVVSLPGGPGGTTTDHAPDFVPEGWGYLLTDPRGVGCNTLGAVPGADDSGRFFQTAEIARDVVAAIKDRNLQEYVVFGVSYGTLLGTHVADELDEQKLPAPRAVVLEGVLGKSYNETFVGAEYILQWDRVRGVLPADVLTELDTKEAPYGISAEGWSRALMSFMPRGTIETANNVEALTTTQPEEVRASVLAMFKDMAEAHPHTEPGAVEMYRQVACREIMDTVPANDLDVIFVKGKLVRNTPEEGTKCGTLRLTTPFDSAQHQFSSKVYYFIGADDVATPAWQGAYHFDHHTGPAVKVVTKGGGHNSLRHNQGPCATQVMASIASGGADLQTVLATCPLPVTVDVK